MVKIKIPKKPPKIPTIPKIPKVPKTPKKPKVTRPKKPPGTKRSKPKGPKATQPKKPPGTVKGPSKKAIAGGAAVAAGLTGIGLYMKHRDKDATASSPKNEQPGRGGQKPYKPYEKPKKPTRPYGKKGLSSGPKKKGTQGKGTPVKWSKGYVKDSKGKVIKHKKLTAAEIRERQKNR